MRELHVVALSEDGRHVVLATRAGAPSGEFRVALDDRLTAAVRGELPAPGRDAPPSISPRDIQARLRDGESPDEIAASAGVPLSRVERYAGPVLAELERMITGARGATVSRPRLGPSALPLGQAVEAHLAEVAHLAEGSVRWSARRGEHGRWVVSVSWTARGRRRTAGWQYDPATREATAVDGPSAVLGHVEAATAAVPAAARVARPAAAAPNGTGRTTGAARSSTAGRAVRTPAADPAIATPSSAAPAAASARSGAGSASPGRPGTPPTASRTATSRTATARTATSRTAAPETPPTRATPSTRATPAASAPGRRSKAPAAATPGNTTAAATPAAATPAPARSTRRRPAAAQEPVPVRTTAKAQPRRPAARRSAVPSLDELAGATADAPATRSPAPSTPTQPPGPPVLRVVPPAAPEPEPEPADDAAPPPEARPARRAAGQRAGGRDWADVLMGGGPAPPAAEPRQD